MARKPGFNMPGIPQHVIRRGNNREPCFFGRQGCRYYMDTLQSASERFDCAIHAYALMTSQVHLPVMSARGDGISAMMQS